MEEREKEVRRKLKNDFFHYAEKCLRIRTKSGYIEKFQLNDAQRHIHKLVTQQKLSTGKVRAIVLKGRQQGCSTYIEGRFYWLTSHRFGVRAFILTHDAEATNNLFEMSQRFHQYCPAVVKPKTDASNAKELIFGQLDSGYKIGTAGNKAVGRSSTIQFLHGSEAAYWPNAAEHAKGIMQAVPSEDGTEVFLESTANGIGNYFHEQWQMAESGQSDFIPIFLPWFWQKEYVKSVDAGFTLTDEEELLANAYNLTNEQLCWRRYKIMELSTLGFDGTKAFMQEYPNSATEAFLTSGEDSFIQPSIVVGARENNLDPVGKLIVGVDPARFGDDRTAIIRRKGRVAYNLQTYTKKDTMEVVGIVHKIIQNERPYKVCIDIGGLGAGVYDRLKELGHIEVIEAVNGGSSPLDGEKYYNKRAEMWAELKQWLIDGPVQIPDSDELHADLCGIRYSIDSKSRLLLEKKEAMKKRGIRSCDTADALAYTFYYQETQLIDNTKEKSDKIIADMMSNFMRIDRIRQNRG